MHTKMHSDIHIKCYRSTAVLIAKRIFPFVFCRLYIHVNRKVLKIIIVLICKNYLRFEGIVNDSRHFATL